MATLALDPGELTIDVADALAYRLSDRTLRMQATRGTRALAIDDVLPADLAETIGRAYPMDGAGFTEIASFRESKLTTNDFDRLPRILRDAAFALQAPEVLAGVERITGISGLRPDPTCYAGGLSLMRPGDFLNPHIDNSHNGGRSLYRRVNLLLYCSPDWRAGDGGELELWDRDVRFATRYKPLFNRLVIMETNRTSWHSVAPIVRGLRRCISSYYFSEVSPDGSGYYHVTAFTGRPGQSARRALGVIDNVARTLARRLGAHRKADRGYAGHA